MNTSRDGGGMGRMGRAESTPEVLVGMAEEHAEVGGDREVSQHRMDVFLECHTEAASGVLTTLRFGNTWSFF